MIWLMLKLSQTFFVFRIQQGKEKIFTEKELIKEKNAGDYTKNERETF